MDKGRWHKVSELIMMIGFIVSIGGLASTIVSTDIRLSVFSSVIGFSIFLVGVEIYLKTRKTA